MLVDLTLKLSRVCNRKLTSCYVKVHHSIIRADPFSECGFRPCHLGADPRPSIRMHAREEEAELTGQLKVSEGALDFIKRMLQLDPEKRPSSLDCGSCWRHFFRAQDPGCFL